MEMFLYLGCLPLGTQRADNSCCIYLGRLGSEPLSVLIKHRAIWRMNCPRSSPSVFLVENRLKPNSAQLALASRSEAALMCLRKMLSCEKSVDRWWTPHSEVAPTPCCEPQDFVPRGSPPKRCPVGGSHCYGSIGQEGSCQPTLCHRQLSAALLGDT